MGGGEKKKPTVGRPARWPLTSSVTFLAGHSPTRGCGSTSWLTGCKGLGAYVSTANIFWNWDLDAVFLERRRSGNNEVDFFWLVCVKELPGWSRNLDRHTPKMQRFLLKFWRVITPGPTQRMSAHTPRPMSPLAACEPSAGQRMLGMCYWKLFAHMLKFLFESGPH